MTKGSCSEPDSVQSGGPGLWEEGPGEVGFVLLSGLLAGGDPGHPHTGPARVPLCLQSSGNVWVTHEEMETLATSTKTVSGAWPRLRGADDGHKGEGQCGKPEACS